MSGRATEHDVMRVVRLLEMLRQDSSTAGHAAAAIDVTASVERRLRGLPRTLGWTPTVSLAQFGLAASVAVVTIILGALGVAGVLAPAGPSAAGSPAPAAGVLAVVSAAVRGLARAVMQGGLELASRLSEARPFVDGAVVIAGEAALVVCIAGITLAALVVVHEARSRRSLA